MADYQEYRRKVLSRRRRKALRAMSALLLAVIFVCSGVLYVFRRQAIHGIELPKADVLTESMDWNTRSFIAADTLSVQTKADGTTAMDFRLAALPQNGVVELSYFDKAVFIGDSITQGLELYETGLPNASYCAYRGVGPSAIVNGSTCKKEDGTEEIAMEALVAADPKVVYVLLGTNVLTRDTDTTSFLKYYSVMLDMIKAAVPEATIYVQSVTPVRPEVSEEENHDGMYKERFCQVNNELAALALEKGCNFLDLWSVLADKNGDLKEEYAQPDGYHLKPDGYAAWVQYLRTHTVYTPWAEYQAGTSYLIEG
jgi:lysophospholipase L1-like esterase